MLELNNVTKLYRTKSGEVAALNGVSLTFPSTGMVFITGKSGCGKTTMLNVIGGLDGIDSGDISVLGKSFASFTQSEYDSYRNTFIGFIFQEYNLLSEFTVEKNIKIAMELQGSEIDEQQFDQLLETVEIADLKNRKPSELSGGQRQRVAIARALVKQPRIIMADEPTGALDSATGVQVLEILKKLSKEKLVIVVSHDQEFAEKYADRIIHLVDGVVCDDVTFSENEIESNLREHEDVLLIKEGADLDKEEINVVANAIKNKKKFEFIKKLSYREKKKTGFIESTVSTEPVELKKSKMKLKSSIALGLKSLTVKPFRLAITILLSALAFAVFGLFDTVANFNTAKVINNVMRSTPTSSVATYGEYTINDALNDKYEVKLSQDLVEELSNKTGYITKGIYNFTDNVTGYTRTTYNILEISSSTVRTGKNYYTTAVNGFIEFGADEINENGSFKNFNYELVEGVYPTAEYDLNEELKPESLEKVAISTYLADSMMHFLGETKLGNKNITERRDLLGKTITVDNKKYLIVGLIDCGDIPEKYDELKTTYASGANGKTLNEDFSAFINSSAHKCLFVFDGFLNEINELEKRADIYYSGNTTWSLSVSGDTKTRQAHKYFYSSNNYNQDNVLLFSNEYATDGSITLADNEILIHPENLEYFFSQEIDFIDDAEDRYSARTIINDLQSEFTTTETKRQMLERFFTLLGGKDTTQKQVTLSRTSEVDGRKTSKDVKVVGVYFDIDPDRATYSANYRIMMNENLMKEFNIYTEQGDYTRLLFSLKGGFGGTNVISEYMSYKTGLSLRWYGNSVLETIEDNEEMIRQGADLFLYVALALALFSIFMLFNYIATSIINKRQSIGVLRGLGSGGKDILYMFMSESLIISIINGILATIIAALGCIFVNAYIANVMHISIAFAIFGIRQVLVIFAMSILTAILSSALPISKIAKEKPVDLIRKF